MLETTDAPELDLRRDGDHCVGGSYAYRLRDQENQRKWSRSRGQKSLKSAWWLVALRRVGLTWRSISVVNPRLRLESGQLSGVS